MESVFWNQTRVYYAHHMWMHGTEHSRTALILNKEWLISATKEEQWRWPNGPFAAMSVQVALVAFRASRYQPKLVPVLTYYWFHDKRHPQPETLNCVWRCRYPENSQHSPFSLLNKTQAIRMMKATNDCLSAAHTMCLISRDQ